MAISLGDIKRKTAKRGEELRERYKQRVLRPWESFSPQTSQTPPDIPGIIPEEGLPWPRTYAAQQAVKRAREIVERNKVMIAEIKKRGPELHYRGEEGKRGGGGSERDKDGHDKKRQYFIDSEITSDSYKIKNKKGLWELLKEMLNH